MTTTLRITEIYPSIQGESTHAGRPCVFVRLTGCPLRCVWCDTAYAFHEGASMEIEDVLAEVRRFDCKLVEVTGGEPLLHPQAVREIAEGARALGMRVHLETGGHRPGALKAVLDVVDSVSPDLKLESATDAPTIRPCPDSPWSRS